MPITRHLSRTSVFEPEGIAAMATAFELACADLAIFANDRRGREIIALRIIDLAREGTLDAEMLHTRVVAQARVSL